MVQMKEKSMTQMLEQVSEEADKYKKERDAFENLAKSYELELRKAETKTSQEALKYEKLMEKFNDFKEKSALKLSNVVEKYNT